MGERGALPVVVLGGSGYVAGELLRLLAGHGGLRVAGVVSTSRIGEPVGEVFPHLGGTPVAELPFSAADELFDKVGELEQLGVFAATPHGETAALVSALLAEAEECSIRLRIVDLSADFRFADPARYEGVYGRPHGAPNLCGSFVCAVPEHREGTPPAHVAHPGCFTTAVVLAAYPLLAGGLCKPEVFAVAVTGSSGAGRALGVGTHHPERRSNLYAYSPLAHRHEGEMSQLLAPATAGTPPPVELVTCSGPFVRGIHATLRLALKAPVAAQELAEEINRFYAESPFVTATVTPPRLTEVLGSNRCRLGVAARGGTVVVTSVIDNLVKGAAGGAVQWMNRMASLADHEGLLVPGLGWV